MSDGSFCYELILISRYDSSTNENYSIINSVKSYLEQKSLGSLVKKEFWGLRSFAYPIQKYKKGHYIFFVLKLNKASNVSLVKNYLKRIEFIVRVFVLRVKHIVQEATPLAVAPSVSKNFDDKL